MTSQFEMANKVKDVTKEMIEALGISYDRDSGTFSKLFRNGNKTRKIGCAYSTGHTYITIGKYGRQPASKVAWLFCTGEWPTGNLYFKDGNPSNLCYENLSHGCKVDNFISRLLTSTNITKINKVKSNDRYSVTVNAHRSKFFVGYFPTEADAKEAGAKFTQEMKDKFLAC